MQDLYQVHTNQEILIQIMTFKSLKFYLRSMGLWKSDAQRHNPILNTIYLIQIINFSVTSFWFFAFSAQTFIEYSKCFYYMTSALLALLWYSIYLYQREKYAQAFAELDKMIEQSKSKFELI